MSNRVSSPHDARTRVTTWLSVTPMLDDVGRGLVDAVQDRVGLLEAVRRLPRRCIERAGRCWGRRAGPGVRAGACMSGRLSCSVCGVGRVRGRCEVAASHQ
jgi:hypothetical protein